MNPKTKVKVKLLGLDETIHFLVLIPRFLFGFALL